MLLAVKVKSTQTRGYVADEIGTLCMSSHSSGQFRRSTRGPVLSQLICAWWHDLMACVEPN